MFWARLNGTHFEDVRPSAGPYIGELQVLHGLLHTGVLKVGSALCESPIVELSAVPVINKNFCVHIGAKVAAVSVVSQVFGVRPVRLSEGRYPSGCSGRFWILVFTWRFGVRMERLTFKEYPPADTVAVG